MTNKEIEAAKDKLPPLFINGTLCEFTPEQERLRKELSCREMINSCLCYNENFMNSRYSKSYVDELGEKRVAELFAEQKADFEKATVRSDVYTDGEGVSYNSIIWADE